MRHCSPQKAGFFRGAVRWVPAVVVLLISASALAQTERLAYEGFDYLEGGVVAGAATGFGWANAWGESGEQRDERSELIIGPGSFPVPPGRPQQVGRHVDLNHATGRHSITRQLTTVLGAAGIHAEYRFGFVLDLGGGFGVDFAGIELSHSAGGPIVFIGKPPGVGPGNRGTLGINVYGSGFRSTGAAGAVQRYLELRWVENVGGPEQLTLTVFNAADGSVIGSANHQTEATFDRITLLARRDLGFGNAIPAFDEINITRTRVFSLTVASTNPASGVNIGVSPADVAAQSNGSTPFSRSYLDGTAVTLTAPTTAAGNSFLKWQLNGIDYSISPSLKLVVKANQALTAVYSAPVPPYEEWAAQHFSDPNAPNAQPSADAEGDGMTNEEEYTAGTDPNDPNSRFLIRSIQHNMNGTVTISWNSVPGRKYSVQRRSELASGSWEQIMAPTTATNSIMTFTDWNPPIGTRHFYRVRVSQ